jgi:hypothetical protein
MGLDMYAFAVPASAVKGEFDVDTEFKKELQYWRKHNALHSWMENLYQAKGGTEKSFNCIPVRLKKEDLLELIEDAKAHKLESAQGFFWGGHYDYNEDYADEDIEFAHKALAEIDKGNAVYYDSWW